MNIIWRFFVKKIAAAALGAALLLAVSSCQLMASMFYNAEGVKASELDDFTGSPAANEAEAKAAVGAGLSSGAVPVARFSVSGQSGDILARAFPRLMLTGDQASDAKSAAASARVLPSTGLTVNDDGSVEYAWSGSEYAVSRDPDVTLSGSLSYSVSADADEEMFAASYRATLDADLQATVGVYDAAGLNGAIMNLKAKGDSSLSGSLTGGYTASGYAAASLYAGFSLDDLSATGGHKGGKYIVSLKYAENYDLSFGWTDLSGIADSAAAKVEIDLVVKVYGNDDKLINTYTFDASEFADEKIGRAHV